MNSKCVTSDKVVDFIFDAEGIQRGERSLIRRIVGGEKTSGSDNLIKDVVRPVIYGNMFDKPGELVKLNFYRFDDRAKDDLGIINASIYNSRNFELSVLFKLDKGVDSEISSSLVIPSRSSESLK